MVLISVELLLSLLSLDQLHVGHLLDTHKMYIRLITNSDKQFPPLFFHFIPVLCVPLCSLCGSFLFLKNIFDMVDGFIVGLH